MRQQEKLYKTSKPYNISMVAEEDKRWVGNIMLLLDLVAFSAVLTVCMRMNMLLIYVHTYLNRHAFDLSSPCAHVLFVWTCRLAQAKILLKLKSATATESHRFEG